jgi:predicted nucleic acid-binding protein
MIVMKPRVYVETSVISYLAARPSADAVSATRQHFSYQLWQKRDRYELLISDAVLSEAAMGDQAAAKSRLSYCAELSRMTLPADTEAIAERLLRSKAMPAKAYTDAVHIAVAALHEVQFIASWNFRHIAGALARRRIEVALAAIGMKVPVIATPEEILESLL